MFRRKEKEIDSFRINLVLLTTVFFVKFCARLSSFWIQFCCLCKTRSRFISNAALTAVLMDHNSPWHPRRHHHHHHHHQKKKKKKKKKTKKNVCLQFFFFSSSFIINIIIIIIIITILSSSLISICR